MAIKESDPRYVAGQSDHDDDMTDAEWVEAYGEYACPHDDVEGDDNVPTEYTCRTCGDTWNGGAE